jgi:transcriptional regulator with XRE-family HTH domain
MGKTLREKLAELSPEDRKEVEQLTSELIASEMTRQELRQARKITQKQIAECLRIDQGNVSRIEQRTDLMLSTLRKYVQAMGGDLQIFAVFPDSEPIALVGFSEEASLTLTDC